MGLFGQYSDACPGQLVTSAWIGDSSTFHSFSWLCGLAIQGEDGGGTVGL